MPLLEVISTFICLMEVSNAMFMMSPTRWKRHAKAAIGKERYVSFCLY